MVLHTNDSTLPDLLRVGFVFAVRNVHEARVRARRPNAGNGHDKRADDIERNKEARE